MSTKMGEYLSSRVPVVYYGPEGIAMTEFLNSHKCAYVITKKGVKEIESLLTQLMHETDLKMIGKAMNIAMEYFNIENVSRNFALQIEKICQAEH